MYQGNPMTSSSVLVGGMVGGTHASGSAGSGAGGASDGSLVSRVVGEPATNVLPNTGAPMLVAVAAAGLALVFVGWLLIRRSRAHEPAPRRSRLPFVVAAAVGVAIAFRALSPATVDSPWEVVGLTVGLFTIGYLVLAVRTLLPTRLEPVVIDGRG